MSCDEQLEEAQREVLCLSRHEPEPQPKGQSASRPERLVTQPCPACFSRPRASRSSSLGSGVGRVFLWCAPSFSSLFFRFSVLVSWDLSRSRECAVATPAIRGVRGVSRGGCAASPCSGKVPPDFERAVAPRAQGADPRTEHLFRYPFSTFAVGTRLIMAVFTDVLGLRFLTHPAVTSASEVLIQTYRSSGVVQWLACWAHNPRSKRAMLHEHVQNRTPEQNVDVPIPRVRLYLRGDPVDPTRAGCLV